MKTAPDQAPPLLRRRVNLFHTESGLAEAFRALDELERRRIPLDGETEADVAAEAAAQLEAADHTIEQSLVASERAEVARDEFVQYLMHAQAHAAALEAEAESYATPLQKEAARIRAGIERMKLSAVKVMERFGYDKIAGDLHTIALKRSRGSVEVFNEDLVPADFKRVKTDEDLEAIRELASYYGLLSCPDTQAKVDALVEAAEARRTAVDKNAVQKAWRENNGNDRRPRTVAELAELDRDLDALHAIKLHAAGDPKKEEALRIMAPLVPGTGRVITTTLELK